MQRNLSLARVWPDEQRYFFDVVMASKDAWDAAFCCGTSSIIRFAPLMAIGGFPTDSVTEDYLLTLRLQAIGFRTVYLNERLSLGLAPEGLQRIHRPSAAAGVSASCRSASAAAGRCGPAHGLSLVDRLILSETFLHWSATHLYRLSASRCRSAISCSGSWRSRPTCPTRSITSCPFSSPQTRGSVAVGRARAADHGRPQPPARRDRASFKAVWQGLTRPKGQKFVVTAKGGDRSKRFVQTRLLALFMTLLLLTIAAISAPSSSTPSPICTARRRCRCSGAGTTSSC